MELTCHPKNHKFFIFYRSFLVHIELHNKFSITRTLKYRLFKKKGYSNKYLDTNTITAVFIAVKGGNHPSNVIHSCMDK